MPFLDFSANPLRTLRLSVIFFFPSRPPPRYHLPANPEGAFAMSARIPRRQFVSTTATAAASASIRRLHAELRDQGKCIIYSTHIMREVEKLCHRIAIIYRGRILAMGSVQELAEHYSEPDMEELFFKLIDRHELEVTTSPVP